MQQLEDHPNLDDIATLVDDLRGTFLSGHTRPMAWRKQQLKALRELFTDNMQALSDALGEDLGKSDFEAWSAELNFVLNELDHALEHMGQWARSEHVHTPVAFQPASSHVRRDPLGVVLIIGPWNYPVQLLMAPLVPALAAGNCALLKPSELAPACSTLLAQLVPKYMDPKAVRIVQGGVPTTTLLLEQQFDHIFFTGSTQVGKIIMRAAAEHLTPVTLELGGKSPCLVDKGARLAVSARRILWGKVFNAGQTCVAPDYVLAHKDIYEDLLKELQKAAQEFFPDGHRPRENYTRIINERHFDRLLGLMEGQTVAIGGTHDREQRVIEPTVLRDVDPKSPVMGEEIFGPILPVIKVDDMKAAVAFVNARPRPLALYVFTQDKKARDLVLDNTTSGGACVNQTMLHLAVPDLPFGGVGPSGMGAYHGRWGFETFSHRKSVLDKTTRVDLPVIYPPYTDAKQKIFKVLL